MINFSPIKNLFYDNNQKKFLKFINKIFYKNKFKSVNSILVENVDNIIHHIPYVYLLNFLVKKFKAEIFIYNPNQLINFKRIIFNLLVKFKKPFFYKILNVLFNVYFLNNSKIILLSKNEKKLLDETKKKIKSKKDFFNLKIMNIYFGDILYDQYLKKNKVPTINIHDKKFEKFFNESLKLIIFWNNFFKKKKIKAVISSHATYWNGIITRIAIKNKIPVYLSDINNTFYLSSKNIFPYKNYLYNKKNFNKFSNYKKNKYRLLAHKRLQLRMSGRVGVDMLYSTKSAWLQNNIKKNVLKKSDKIKILISAHCFFDSPNGWGKNLFTDFYEWILFLSKISKQTDYDWYIKTHPDFLPGNLEIIRELSKKFDNLKILNPNTSHHHIINNKIDVVLTVYGTIAIEYAYNNIPVINASLNNPNINYKYNLHPKNIKEYSSVLRHLKKLKIKIKRNDVLENYYMNHMAKDNNIFFFDTIKFNRKYESQINNLKTDFYNFCKINFNKQHHINVIKKVESFINSKKYTLLK